MMNHHINNRYSFQFTHQTIRLAFIEQSTLLSSQATNHTQHHHPQEQINQEGYSFFTVTIQPATQSILQHLFTLRNPVTRDAHH